MNILVVSPYFYPAYGYGGPVSFLFETARAWILQGHSVHVVTTNANGKITIDADSARSVQIEGITVDYCRRLMFDAVSLQFLFKLPRAIKSADIVFLSFTYSFPTVPVLALCKIFKKKLVWTTHGALQEWRGTKKKFLKRAWNGVCRALLPETAVMHYVSALEAAAGNKKFPGRKYLIIPNGVNPEITAGEKIPSAKIRLLFLGRLDPVKGLENLIAAMRDIDAAKYRLDIYGAGSRVYVECLKKSAGKNIFFHGSYAHADLKKIFLDADVLILPSQTESFGNVVVEALAYGVPVIASRGTPWQELEEYRCGLWVDNRPGSLADAIRRISVLPHAEMGKKGRMLVMRNYRWSDLARRLIVEALMM